MYRLDINRWALIADTLIGEAKKTEKYLAPIRKAIEDIHTTHTFQINDEDEKAIRNRAAVSEAKLKVLKDEKNLDDRETEWLRMGIVDHVSSMVDQSINELRKLQRKYIETDPKRIFTFNPASKEANF
jgi:hypothetical protein